MFIMPVMLGRNTYGKALVLGSSQLEVEIAIAKLKIYSGR
jgi:hypothetical protein